MRFLFLHLVYLIAFLLIHFWLIRLLNASIFFYSIFMFQEAKDPLEKAVLDGRQLALKVFFCFIAPFCSILELLS